VGGGGGGGGGGVEKREWDGGGYKWEKGVS